MVDPHCIVVAQSLVKSVPTALLCYLKSSKDAGWFSPAALPALIAFAGGLIGLLWNGWLQRRVDQKKRDQTEQTARAIAYAELWRIWRETNYAVEFVKNDSAFQGGMIWIPVFRSIFPNKDNLARIEPLTAKEVGSITSAFYVYQEAMVFLKAAAYAVLPLVEQHGSGVLKRRAPFFSLDEDAIEYVYKIDGQSEVGRREEVLKWLRIIAGQVGKALKEIERSVEMRFPRSDLAVEVRRKNSTTVLGVVDKE
ncbi:hypothetical protein [Sphingomonas solaris]|uniref:Uncharacterized protein n=1 Tax=Alterirhizorhabdus solaris TaxID=2529389 RepID=A0A558R9I2_9SPHN|nr:hypothetical protein [Sphingomonas solaris]TVV76036.1 hypothetical protein FOY91_05510 [Sphingomonas solaris]